MNKFLSLSAAQRRNVFNALAPKAGVSPQVLEKDFWVTAVLQALFGMPFSGPLVFKGGTSLSKGWHLIHRFSEDIDLAIDPRLLGAPEGDVTKKQIKRLRKASSLFVKEQMTPMIAQKLADLGLDPFVKVEAQPDGVGDNTYPVPRRIYIRYLSVFDEGPAYLRPDIVLEVSARSLLEPAEPIHIRSLVREYLPSVVPIEDNVVCTATPDKTFLEKAFLLHELFSVPDNGAHADRKSRHLYDLYMMMDKEFARQAVADDELWESIRRHREVYTSVRGVDYEQDVRKRIRLVPPEGVLEAWRDDYSAMSEAMIYGRKPSFDALLQAMMTLQERFRRGRA